MGPLLNTTFGLPSVFARWVDDPSLLRKLGLTYIHFDKLYLIVINLKIGIVKQIFIYPTKNCIVIKYYDFCKTKSYR